MKTIETETLLARSRLRTRLGEHYYEKGEIFYATIGSLVGQW